MGLAVLLLAALVFSLLSFCTLMLLVEFWNTFDLVATLAFIVSCLACTALSVAVG